MGTLIAAPHEIDVQSLPLDTSEEQIEQHVYDVTLRLAEKVAQEYEADLDRVLIHLNDRNVFFVPALVPGVIRIGVSCVFRVTARDPLLRLAHYPPPRPTPLEETENPT